MSASATGKLLENTDIGPKFEEHRRLFLEQFSVLSTEERLEMWLQMCSQFTAIMISEEIGNRMREAGQADITTFLVSAQLSGNACSTAFSNMLCGRLSNAQSAVLGRLGDRHG